MRQRVRAEETYILMSLVCIQITWSCSACNVGLIKMKLAWHRSALQSRQSSVLLYPKCNRRSRSQQGYESDCMSLKCAKQFICCLFYVSLLFSKENTDNTKVNSEMCIYNRWEVRNIRWIEDANNRGVYSLLIAWEESVKRKHKFAL